METKTINSNQGGAFLLKETAPQDIFCPEDFSEEQQMMKESVKEFVDREIWPHKVRFEQKDYAFTEALMKQAGDQGFLCVGIPETYGGLGMNFVSTMLVCDYVSGASGSFSTAFGAHTGIGTLPILLYGTEQQKQYYIPKLATGEWIGAYCLTEPGAGSDANSGKTKALLSKDGTHYTISGQKMWISNAGYADVFTVFARIEDDKNITGFIVPNDPENGITLGEEEHKLGIHASSTRQVFFNETKVPVENMLANRGEGFKIAINALNVGRIKLGVACLEAQRRTITVSVQYAKERIQFKTPIAEFGAIKEKIARMATTCFTGESACYRAAHTIDQAIALNETEGLTLFEAELKAFEEFAVESSIIKVACSEAVQNCADDGIQIFGGMGFSADTPMESAWRDARIGRIYEGTNEINSMLAVGMVMKKGLKGQLPLMEAIMQAAALMGEKSEPQTFKEDLDQERQLLKNCKTIFLMLLGNAMQTYQKELEKQQQLLLAMATILIEIYMTESMLLRILKIKAKESMKEKVLTAMAQLQVFEATEQIRTQAKKIVASLCQGDSQKQLYAAVEQQLTYAEVPNTMALKTIIADEVIAANGYCF